MNRKRAFTLVELLVVVVIIGILSSLVTVGVMSAVQAAKRSKIAMEMHQITLALETYKNKFGEYPPDLYDKAAVVRHVKKRWPRFQLPTTTTLPSGTNIIDYQYWAIMKAICNVYQNKDYVAWLNTYGYSFAVTTFFMDEVPNSPSDYKNTLTREASYIGALAFWLGGFPDQTSLNGKFAGFSADPEAPFGKESTTKSNNGDPTYTWTPNNILLGSQDKDSVFYEMIIKKNIAYVITKNNRVFPVLVNLDATANKDGTNPVPYVYFRGKPSGDKTSYLYLVDDTGLLPIDTDYNVSGVYKPKCYGFSAVFSGAWSELGLISAYAQSGNDPNIDNPHIIWREPERFQLIHPGLDGVFGKVGNPQTTYILNNPSNGAYPKLKPNYFRSTDTNITVNDIGQKDFDNLTNFSDYQQIKSILP